MAMPMNGSQLQRPTVQALSRPGSKWSGYDAAMMTTSPYSQQQRNNFNQAGQMGLQGLLSGQMPGGMSFDPIRQKAETQFRTETIPSIAQRFAGMGDTRNSSAFQSALGRASSGLHENLSAMESEYNRGMAPLLMQLLQMGQTPQEEQQFLPRDPGLWENLGGQAVHGFASALPGFAAGGGFGSILSGIKSLFGGGQGQQQTQQDPRAMLTALFKALQQHGTFQ